MSMMRLALLWYPVSNIANTFMSRHVSSMFCWCHPSISSGWERVWLRQISVLCYMCVRASPDSQKQLRLSKKVKNSAEGSLLPPNHFLRYTFLKEQIYNRNVTKSKQFMRDFMCETFTSRPFGAHTNKDAHKSKRKKQTKKSKIV